MPDTLCSCVIQTGPGQGAPVAARVAAIAGCEVHGGIAGDKLIVTIEEYPGGPASADLLVDLNRLPGVVNTILIYHYGGDDLDRPLVTADPAARPHA